MPLATVLPTGALIAGFFLVALPIIILMAVWAGITMVRILFPEKPLPFEAAARRHRATMRGETRPVRLRDIIEDEARRRAEPTAVGGAEAGPPRHPFVDDLWLRRN